MILYGVTMRFVSAFVVLVLASTYVYAQESHKGKEFYWVVPPGGTGWPLAIFISSDEVTKGYVTLRDEFGRMDTLHFGISNPLQPAVVTCDADKVMLRGAQSNNPGIYKDNLKPNKRYVYIHSESDIEVSMLHYMWAAADRTIIYPLHTYGTEYTVFAPPSEYNKYIRKKDNQLIQSYFYSQCVVVATQNNTTVNIESPVNLIGDFEKNITAVLQKGESYLIQARPTTTDTSADITGMKITSSAPVSIIAGATQFRYGLLKDSIYTTNCVFEHILPSKLYGLLYIITDPAKSTNESNAVPNYYKITALNDTATIMLNEGVIKKLNRGENIVLPLINFAVIKSSSPISILLLRRSGSLLSVSTTSWGDPFMTDIAAAEFWQNKYNIHLALPKDFYNPLPFSENYINVVIPTEYIPQLKINGNIVNKNLFTHISSFPLSGFCQELSYATLTVNPSSIILEAPVPFGISCYGYGNADAYGYIPGRNMNPIEFPKVRSSYKDTIICPGSSVQLSANGGDNTYTWSPKEGLSCSDCSNPIATPTKNTTYTVTSNNAFGCAVLKDTVRIIIQPAQVDAGKDVGICSGDSIKLSVTEGKNYLWSPSEGLSCTDCREPFATPTKNQRYYVTITDLKGCIGTDSVLVSVGKPTADAGNDTTICLGKSVRVRATGGNTYRWAASSDLSCTDCPDPIVTPKQSTTYKVTSYLSANCFAMDSIRITVDKPTIIITSDKTILCPTDSVFLKAEGGIQTKWLGEGIVCDNCSETKASPTKSGYYKATITTATGCTISDSVFITLNTPTAKVSSDTTICKGSTAQLRAEGGTRYSWSPPTALSCTDCARPTAIPQQTTNYTVTTYDNNNCTAQASVLITVDTCPIIIKADTITLNSSLNCAQIEDEQRYKHSSDKPLQLQVPELISGDGSAFVVYYNIPTNSTLNNKDELIITTELLSISPTLKQAVYRLGISQERELHLKASGEYITKTASLRPMDTLGVIPGEGYVPIRLQADGDIEQIRELRTILSFPSRFMNYVPNKHQIISSAGWNFGIEKSEEKNGITSITLRGTGTTTLSDKKEIVMIETDIYLGDSVEFTVMTEQSEVPNECYTIPQGKGIVSLGGCFAGGRAINTGIPYSVQAKTENNTLIIDYTAGLDGITECKILNTFGEHIADILYRTDTKGEYRVNYPMESLSSGNYIILFRSGIFHQSQLLNIVK